MLRSGAEREHLCLLRFFPHLICFSRGQQRKLPRGFRHEVRALLDLDPELALCSSAFASEEASPSFRKDEPGV